MSVTTKQVIVMRVDLGMTVGKMIAQGAHASLAFLSKRLYTIETEIKLKGSLPKLTESFITLLSLVEDQWFKNSYTKICLAIHSEEELLKIKDEADEAGLECHLITDNGQTHFKGVKTNTCLAIGPDYSDEIDKITGHLKLL